MIRVILSALWGMLFLASKPLHLWNGSLGIFYLIFAICLAFNEGKKRNGAVKVINESELEVGKVYKKKGEIFFDDRVIEMGTDIGKVTGGQYITLLEDEEGNPIVVSFKQPAYGTFKVTDDKENPYLYVDDSRILKKL